MEEEKMEESSGGSPCWSAATNWTVADGSLQNSISFESPVFPIPEEKEVKNAVLTKDQLILQPPPSDSAPCEINVTFTQRHEARQVYVRSTARVFEIYYATEQQSGNEYLCTVRCGVAAREGEILHTGNGGEAIAELQDGNGKAMELPKEITQSSSSSSNDEDGWVEVKVPDSPLNGTTNPMSNKIDGKTDRKTQDYYEATAEITDASPCISIIIRLLSLQVKGCVFVEEIYIFADPVESTDSDHQAGPSQNSAGSNLLAMLVPSLLQLSKSRQERIQDRHVHDTGEARKLQDGGLKATELISPEMGRVVQQGTPSNTADPRVMTMKELSGDTAECEQLGSGRQIPGAENIPESEFVSSIGKNNHLDRMLDQLDTRMGRIEAFCARFEENMLKPLSCMAMRLEQLEQKLDALALRSQPSTSFSCSRFAAPEFSFGDSESNDASESMQKDLSVEKPSSINDNATASVTFVPELRPCLIVTAPEFSNDDDDGDRNCGDSSESVTKDHTAPEFSKDADGDEKCGETSESVMKDHCMNKPSLSIDDALALALSAFISSASTQPPKLIPTLIVKAPEFANEDDSNEELLSPSAGVSCEGSENPSINCCRSDGIDGSCSTKHVSTSPVRVSCKGSENPRIDCCVNDGIDGLGSTKCVSPSQEGEICEHHMKWLKDSPAKALSSARFIFEGAENPKDSESTLCNSQDSNIQEHHHMKWANDSPTKTAANVDVTQNQLHMGGVEDSCEDTSRNRISAQDWDDIQQADGGNAETTANGAVSFKEGTESTHQTNRSSADAVKGTSPGQFYEEQNNDCDRDATNNGDITRSGSTTGVQLQNEGHDEAGLENELTQASKPAVDFNLPILDVKFTSQENCSSRLTLEYLLGDLLEKEMQDSGVGDAYDDAYATTVQQNHMVSFDGSGSKDPAVINQFLELEDLSVEDVASCTNGEELQDHSAMVNQEPFSGLI
ncbi:uncharacterized protein LOC131222540 [Magnolia sinica]|uniref:uncharacterized protein LOC131222540 n=1 Tax=Magnolia sinica TaxID=86752 RepID=UPI00265A1A9A|nr:uncharacterized protein LOC131222540 [Magnolia sinica]